MFAIAVFFAISTDTVLYQSNHHLYSVAKADGGRLLLLDYDTGRLSRLRPAGDGYVAGPSIGIDSPVAMKVLADDESLRVNEAPPHVVAGDSPAGRPRSAVPTEVMAKRVDAFRTEQVAGGTLYQPSTPGKHPLMIVVPGAPATLIAPYFARRGVAVLALDQRDGWQSRTFGELAKDVTAAANAMKSRSDIGKIGIYATTQGGWIAPIAAATSSDIAFVICSACAATTMPQQEVIRTRYELRADGFPPDAVADAVAYRKQLFTYLHDGTGRPQLEKLDFAFKSAKWYARFGGVPAREATVAQWWRMNDASDPAASWRHVRVPALLLFGEKDTQVPPAEHAKLIAAANPKAKIVVVPRIDHEGLIAVTGGRDEVPLLDRMPPRALEPTIDWILAR